MTEQEMNDWIKAHVVVGSSPVVEAEVRWDADDDVEEGLRPAVVALQEKLGIGCSMRAYRFGKKALLVGKRPKRVANTERALWRAEHSGTFESAERLTRGRSRSDMSRTINCRRRKDLPVMPEDELRLACVDLVDRNEQLEHLLRSMLGTIQVGLTRNEFGIDTLQELYDMWKEAA